VSDVSAMFVPVHQVRKVLMEKTVLLAQKVIQVRKVQQVHRDQLV
jgi:hypothetical protein